MNKINNRVLMRFFYIQLLKNLTSVITVFALLFDSRRFNIRLHKITCVYVSRKVLILDYIKLRAFILNNCATEILH